jgi:predicted transposase YbfD/YdcC
MKEMEQASISVFFGNLEDPRVERTRRHNLIDIVVISVLAVICGAESWEEIADFGCAQENWLRTFLLLPSGIPSHHTFRRVFAALDVAAFHQCFLSFTQALVGATDGKLIAIDGKTLRRSFSDNEERDARHIVSAWVGENHVVLGQIATEAKSNEITAIPKLLDMLDVRGATITIDAMGCQRKIVEKIAEKGAQYAIAVKDNQPTLRQEIESAFVTAAIAREDLPSGWIYQSSERAHGRTELRRVTVLDVHDRLSVTEDWTGLRSLACVETERTIGGKTSQETRFYISSHEPDAEVLAKAIRGHWGIENEQHWTLDMAFNEDRCRSRKKNGPENFALLRRFALNILKLDTSCKRSIRGKRMRAGWNREFLLGVITASVLSASSLPHVG